MSFNTLEGRKCWFCGAETALERHHIFGGYANRKISEKYGMCVYLCFHHHRDNNEGVHGNRQQDLKLKRWAQKEFNKKYPDIEFIDVFGRNYL
ncbi:MAG: hypothetical protein GT601_05865 [Acidaminobacter sp.]|uniref:hypothetical protein n=1 Tax=Acidaminobacter sp. TaxID=1872102 RepID=UPI00137DF315|nr:hypothetical protein [Acidaminobacter sp.]MZQ97182.1 hypothetical protein [Acidaminobacter sp.]